MAIPFTPYPYVQPRLVESPVARSADSLQQLFQQYAAMKQASNQNELARQQKILELAKATDEGGQEFMDRYKAMGGQVPGAAPANNNMFSSLFHGLPSQAAANPAPMTLTSSSLAPNQSLPRTPTSAPTFTPTEREDTALQSLPSEHPLLGAAIAAPPAQSSASQPTFPIPSVPTPAPSPASPIPSIGAAPSAPPLGPTPSAAPSAIPSAPLPPITKATDITPDYLEQVKKLKGTKGLKEFMDSGKYVMEQNKDQNTIDQNTPASLQEAQAMLSPYGDAGQKAFQQLKAAYPTGQIQKSILNGTASALAGSTKGDYYNNMGDIREAQLREGLIKDARSTINPAFQSGPGKEQVDRLNSIQRAQVLGQQMLAQAGSGDSRQMRELATSMAKVIQGGGVSAQSQIDDLVPQTARGKFAHWQEFLTNNPTGADQQAFVKRYMDTLDRERGVIQGQIKNTAESNAPTMRVLKERYPNDYQTVLNSVLTNPQYASDFTQSSASAGPSAPAAPSAPQVGEVRRGYKFTGGNPADPKAWVQQ